MKVSEPFVAWRAILMGSSSLSFAEIVEEDTDEHFIRVLVANRGSRNEPLDRGSTDEFLHAYRLWSSRTEAFTGPGTDGWPISEAMKVVGFLGSVRRACVGRRIFVSQKGGFVGLAPRETVEGDFVISSSLTDSKLFLVLRETSVNSAEFVLVGTWYVYAQSDLCFRVHAWLFVAHC